MFGVNQRKIFRIFAVIAVFFAVFFLGIFVGRDQVVCNICTPDNVDFSLFWDAYNKLHQHFISPDKIVDQKIVYGAIAGMTQSLKDPYTSFFNPDQAKAFEQDLAGSFEGIGIEVGLKKDQLTIIAPLKGTPSDKAGLKSGDQII